jgi:hypothetical protein
MTKIALIRVIMGALASLGILLPILAVLKAVGIPLLIIMGIIALPILIVLLLVGLPIFLVLIFGAMLLGVAWAFLTAGAVIIKPLIFVGLPMFLIGYGMWWLAFGRRRGGGEKPA